MFIKMFKFKPKLSKSFLCCSLFSLYDGFVMAQFLKLCEVLVIQQLVLIINQVVFIEFQLLNESFHYQLYFNNLF